MNILCRSSERENATQKTKAVEQCDYYCVLVYYYEGIWRM